MRHVTLFERKMNIGNEEISKMQERKYIAQFLENKDQETIKQHMIKQVEYQKVNDKIMQFAQKSTKVSKANRDNQRENSGIKSVSKAGVQKFKYQEI